jgi:hypothetical protein
VAALAEVVALALVEALGDADELAELEELEELLQPAAVSPMQAIKAIAPTCTPRR